MNETDSRKVILKLGNPDEEVPCVETDYSIFKRSGTFGPLLDPSEPVQEVCLGLDYEPQHLEFIFEFIRRCHAEGKTEDPPATETWSPKDPHAYDKFEIPEHALDLIREVKDPVTGVLDIKKFLLDLCPVAHYLKITHFMEGVSQVIASVIKDKSGEEIQELMGFEKKYTDEMEKELIEKFPWCK